MSKPEEVCQRWGNPSLREFVLGLGPIYTMKYVRKTENRGNAKSQKTMRPPRPPRPLHTPLCCRLPSPLTHRRPSPWAGVTAGPGQPSLLGSMNVHKTHRYSLCPTKLWGYLSTQFDLYFQQYFQRSKFSFTTTAQTASSSCSNS